MTDLAVRRAFSALAVFAAAAALVCLAGGETGRALLALAALALAVWRMKGA